MLEWLVAILVGAVAGFGVNYLADLLPYYRLSDEDDDTDLDELQETTEAEPEKLQPFKWSITRFRSPRYLIVIALLAGLAGYVWQREGSIISAVVLFVYLALFTLIAVIDIEHRLVLTVIMIPAFMFALIEIALTSRIHIADALVGYAAAQIIQMVFYLFGGLYLALINARRGEPIREVAFGFGDVTLATFCGLVIGWPDTAYMLILMVLIGGAMGFFYLVVRLIITRKYEAHMAIPYGPAIVIAAAVMLLWGSRVAYYMLGGR